MALAFWGRPQRNPTRVATFYAKRLRLFVAQSDDALRATYSATSAIRADLKRLVEMEHRLRQEFASRWNIETPRQPATREGTLQPPGDVVNAGAQLADQLRRKWMPLTANGKLKSRRRESTQVDAMCQAAISTRAATLAQLTGALANAFPRNNNVTAFRRDIDKVRLPPGVIDGWAKLSAAKPGGGALIMQVGTVAVTPVCTLAQVPTGYCNNLSERTLDAVERPLVVPALVDFDTDGGLVTNSSQTVVSTVLRLLSLLPAGELKLHIFDPLQLGSSIKYLNDLADASRAAITGSRIHATQRDFEALLDALSRHIAEVTQQYLGSRHASLRSYNHSAGETAEAYRLLVVLDYPAGIQAPNGSVDAAVLAKLETIIKAGPACGVYTVVLASHRPQSSYTSGWQDAAPKVPAGLPVLLDGARHTEVPRVWPSLTRQSMAPWPAQPNVSNSFEDCCDAAIHGNLARLANVGQVMEWKADTSPVNTVEVGALIRRLDSHVANAPSISVDPGRVSSLARSGQLNLPTGTSEVADPTNQSTWWGRSSTRGIRITVGRQGDRGVAEIFLSSNEPATLIGGRPGSGKSVLLHAIICDILRNYAPSEVQMFLLDPKHGVEFSVYAEAKVPHATAITVSSAPDCTTSILETLLDKMKSRGTLFRKAGVHDIDHYRPINRGNPMPRIVVIVDEFQKLLDTDDDAVSARAADVINKLIREGRAFGIHLVLATQSLYGVNNLPSALGMILTRVALQMSDDDSRRILGDTRGDAATLNRTGQAILQRGPETTNIQVTHESQASIQDTVRVVKAKAAQLRPAPRGPKVIDFSGTNLPDGSVAKQLKAVLKGTSAVFPVGVHYGLEPSQLLKLDQTANQNVLLVISSDCDRPDYSSAVAVMGMLIAGCTRANIPFDVIDYAPAGSAFSTSLAAIKTHARIGQGQRFHSRAHTTQLITGLHQLVDKRNANPSVHPSRLLLLGHVDAADEISAGRGGSNYDLITDIVQQGPAVGVHVVASTSSYRTADDAFGGHLLGAFSHKIVGKMSADDAISLTNGYEATRLDTDELQYVNPVGATTKLRAFGLLPPTFWSRI